MSGPFLSFLFIYSASQATPWPSPHFQNQELPVRVLVQNMNAHAPDLLLCHNHRPYKFRQCLTSHQRMHSDYKVDAPRNPNEKLLPYNLCVPHRLHSITMQAMIGLPRMPMDHALVALLLLNNVLPDDYSYPFLYLRNR